MPPGMMPAPMMRATHSPPSSDLLKPISAARPLGAGDDAEEIVAAGIEVLAARRSTSPVISTSSQPSRLLVVMPYLRQCTPPEFSATLPPMVQAICDDGSGA